MSARHPDLYGITAGSGHLVDVERAVLCALDAGLGWVQIREKAAAPADLLRLARRLVASGRTRAARILLNDRADIAVAAGAAGVHLTERSMDVASVRRAFPELLIGVSAHQIDRAERAADAGCDFILLGPVFATPSKQEYGPALGLGELARVVARVSVPVVAVGGIGPAQVGSCLDAGASGVAAIRELLGSRDPAAAVYAYRAELIRSRA